MEKRDHRPVTLAGIGLVRAGAVLGLVPTAPDAASDAPRAEPEPAGQKDR